MKIWRKPLEQAEQTTILAHVLVDKERCKGCGFCVEFCHMNVLEMSSEIGAKGYKSALIKDESKCLNCGFCEAICPEFAIKILLSVKAKSAKGVLTQ